MVIIDVTCRRLRYVYYRRLVQIWVTHLSSWVGDRRIRCEINQTIYKQFQYMYIQYNTNYVHAALLTEVININQCFTIYQIYGTHYLV